MDLEPTKAESISPNVERLYGLERLKPQRPTGRRQGSPIGLWPLFTDAKTIPTYVARAKCSYVKLVSAAQRGLIGGQTREWRAGFWSRQGGFQQ